MGRYVLRRVLQIPPLVLVVMCVNFLLIHVTPGDPASALAGENADAAYIAQLRERLGLDESLGTQLWKYVAQVAQGDLGYSFTYQRPVLSVVTDRLPATFLLLALGVVPAIVLGTLAGAYSARHRGRWADRIVSLLSLAFYSVPVFWIGLMLVLMFSLYLGWFPTSGMTDYAGDSTVWTVLHHAVLPAAALCLYTMPTYVRLTRSAMAETLDEDFVRMARAIGYPERSVIYRHALRNALLPSITVAGLSLGMVFSGSLLVETVFAWPGMGQLTYNAVAHRDYPVLMGAFLVASLSVAVAMLVADLAYALADPRVRLTKAAVV